MKLNNNTKNVTIDNNSQFENTFAGHINKLLPELGTSDCKISGTGTNNSIIFSVDKSCLRDLYTKLTGYIKNNKEVSFSEVKNYPNSYQFYLKNTSTTQKTSTTSPQSNEPKRDEPIWGQALASAFGVQSDGNLQLSGYFYDNKKTINEEIDRMKKLMKR